ncbi:MAG: type 4a pilus biogenesis protein PilO [Candidatus Eisenbacteria bacterium]|uniref:Type 4a pilus biogenesis protein PilO n=1 Tax=Eiseniibacteriota bacterium TaxID=2212470 RepID=A0A9D6L6E6_UNCEI|nr:type 4a pilus biogenesis protein PilO [Candidatus Eisenbacteria bacterium]
MANLDLKNPTVLKIVLAVLIAAGVLGVFFFTHFLPFGFPNQREQLQTLKADYEKKSTDLARARAAVADLPRFEAEYELLHDRWTTASELLPTDRQLAVLLRKISLAGQQTGVSFLMFKPGATKTESYYTELPVEISVFGGYHQVGSFLAELANMRRIVTVSNMHLSANSKGDGLATTSASITASAYSLNTSAAPGAASAPAATHKKGAGDGRKES